MLSSGPTNLAGLLKNKHFDLRADRQHHGLSFLTLISP